MILAGASALACADNGIEHAPLAVHDTAADVQVEFGHIALFLSATTWRSKSSSSFAMMVNI